MTKTAAEQIWRYHQFLRPDGRGWLASGETIATATVTCATIDGVDATAAMISGAAPYSGTQVKYLVKAGTSGISYIITVTVTTSNGQTFADRIGLDVTV